MSECGSYIAMYGGWFGIAVSAMVISTKLSYVEPEPLAGLPSQYLVSPLNLVIPPWVGAMSTGNWWWFQQPLVKKWQVLHSSRTCYQNCWLILDYWNASLIRSNPCNLKGKRGWANSQQTSLPMHKSYITVAMITWSLYSSWQQVYKAVLYPNSTERRLVSQIEPKFHVLIIFRNCCVPHRSTQNYVASKVYYSKLS